MQRGLVVVNKLKWMKLSLSGHEVEMIMRWGNGTVTAPPPLAMSSMSGLCSEKIRINRAGK